MRPLFTSTPVAYIGETIITDDERRILCEALVKEAQRLHTLGLSDTIDDLTKIRLAERGEGILWAFNMICATAARIRIEAKLPTGGSNDNGRNC